MTAATTATDPTRRTTQLRLTMALRRLMNIGRGALAE
jgi:hypothetical protein